MSLRLPLAFALLLCAMPGAALAHDFKVGDIEIDHPWSRATPGGATVAAGYVTLKNRGDNADRLVSAAAEIAGATEIHAMSMTGGVMQMRPVPDGVVVPAGGEVVLAPGGYHLMFMDLKRPLQEGESFAGTLSFEHAGSVDVTFSVEKTGAGAPGGSGQHDHH